jgi:AcrR family transcriptional regulator
MAVRQGVSGLSKTATRAAPVPAIRVAKSKIGRPTREEAQRRQDELLDAAADLFLDMGYNQATMELIAGSLGMTKRTIYSRYADKAALFRATVQHAIERMVAGQADELRALENTDLETLLAETARMRIRQVMSRDGVRLQRIINAESYRFPEIFVMANQQVTRPVIVFLSDQLRRHIAMGAIDTDRPKMAATAFMSMVVSAPVRVIVSGNRVDPADIEDRIRFSVELFLEGLKPSGSPLQRESPDRGSAQTA